MAFKIGKIAQAKVRVKASIPDGENMREEKMLVGMNIFSNTEQQRLKKELAEAGSKDVELDFLRQHAITSVEGPQFEDGTALSIDDVLDVPYLRVPIDNWYQLTMSGVKQKN